MTYLLLCLAPFVQTGFSYYASVASLMAIVAVVVWAPSLRQMPLYPLAKLLLIAGMGLSVVASSADVASDSLRVAREAVFFFLIATVFEQAPTVQPTPARDFTPLALIVVGALFILTLAQWVGALGHQFVGLPVGWFSQNQGTLPRLVDLQYSHVRPWGTFGEPSYFAFFLISMFVGFAPMAAVSVRARWLLGLIVASGLLIQSLAFVVLIGPIAYVTVYRRMAGPERGRALIAVGAIGLLVAGAGAAVAVGRFSAAGGIVQDASLHNRILAPARVALGYLVEHPFGSGWSSLYDNLSAHTRPVGIDARGVADNAFFSTLFTFGWAAVALWAYFVFAARDRALLVYLLACFIFNGALFTPDKFAVMALAVWLSVHAEALAGNAHREAVRPANLRSLRGRLPVQVRRSA